MHSAGGTTSSLAAPQTIAFHLVGPPTPTCAQAVVSGSPEAVVSAFRAARIAGHGAEGCLTRGALARYCGPLVHCGPGLFSGPDAPSPGPICLYACNGWTVSGITAGGAYRSKGTVSVDLEVTAATPARSGTDLIDNEEIFLGPGVPSNGSQTDPMVIVDASTSG